MWLVIQYTGRTWLFINSYTILVDGRTYSINPGFQEVERDNGGFMIWEWYQFQVSKPDVDMIEKIANSKSAEIRYYGDQYYDDGTISKEEKQAFKNVLAAYEVLG